MEKYEQAELDYIDGMKYKDIAEKYGTSVNTVKSWKQRYNWVREKHNSKDTKKEGAHKNKKVCIQKIKGAAVKEETENEHLFDSSENPALDERKKLFCLFYSQTFNATQSYQKAYGCSLNTARAHGCKLLQNVEVKSEIEYLTELKRQQLLAKESDFVELQMRIAFADAGDYYEIKNNKIKWKDSDQTDTQLIREAKTVKGEINISLYDKQKAIDWLTKYFLMHPDDKYKAEFDKKRAEVKDNSAEQILANMQTLADILQTPVTNRSLEDFEKDN